MKYRIQDTIYDYCRHGQATRLERLLKEVQEVPDLLYKEGVYFDFAIKQEDPTILKVLIDQYEKGHEPGTLEYNIHKHSLKKLLEHKLDSQDEIPINIKQILRERSYLRNDEEDSTEDEFELSTAEYSSGLGDRDMDTDFNTQESALHGESSTYEDDMAYQ